MIPALLLVIACESESFDVPYDNVVRHCGGRVENLNALYMRKYNAEAKTDLLLVV